MAQNRSVSAYEVGDLWYNYNMKKTFLVSPVAWIALVAALLIAWALVEPATIIRCMDADGRSPFELLTLPFYAAIVPMVWWKCPFAGSKSRRVTLCVMVSLVAVMAVVKELDLHQVALRALYPDFVGEGGGLLPGLYKPNGNPLVGTPFKMRVITNAGVPFGMKLAIVGYFAAFFGTFAAGFAYLFKNWIVGVFKLVPSAWAVGCFGASGVLVQVADRLPAWLDHKFGLEKAEDAVTAAQSLCTVLEEGGELLIAVFAILAIVLGNRERKAE